MKLFFKLIGFFLLWQTLHTLLLLLVVNYFYSHCTFLDGSLINNGLTIVPLFSSLFTGLMFYSRNPSESQRLKYKYKLLAFAIIPTALLSIIFSQTYRLHHAFSISKVKIIVLLFFLLLLYQTAGIYVAQILSIFLKTTKNYKFMKYCGLILLSASLMSYLTKPLFMAVCQFASSNTDSSVRKLNPNELKQTNFTPVLNEKIFTDKNLIWTATYQLCWDNFKTLPFLKPGDFPEKEIVQKLNQEPFDLKAIDEATYVSLVSQKKIDFSNKIASKFKKDNSQLLKNMPEESIDQIFFFSYLESNLPFKSKFIRNPLPLTFSDGQKVNSFGIKLYNSYNSSEKEIVEQVIVKYSSENEMIIELKTTNKDHHLILALVPPKNTLAETISAVDEFIKLGEKETYIIRENTNINIPIINFDITQSYPELENLKIGPGTIEQSKQRIKFKLNESGAFIISEAIVFFGLGSSFVSNIIFDKPFLVMLRYKDEKKPYFAAWIGNSELLEKSDSSEID